MFHPTRFQTLADTIQEIGVKTDRNGFLSEDGLVAFYRDFGRLADDVEAAGVSFQNKLDCLVMLPFGFDDMYVSSRIPAGTGRTPPGREGL